MTGPAVTVSGPDVDRRVPSVDVGLSLAVTLASIARRGEAVTFYVRADGAVAGRVTGDVDRTITVEKIGGAS